MHGKGGGSQTKYLWLHGDNGEELVRIGLHSEARNWI